MQRLLSRAALLLSASLLAPSGAAFGAEPGTPSSCERLGTVIASACDGGARAWREGSWDLYLSGVSYHGRNTYSQEKLETLNERSLGGGLGRRYGDEKGNTHLLYAMAFQDSHSKPQYVAGYGWLKQWRPLGEDGPRLGAGVTAFLMLRTDYSDYRIPVPALLPLAELGWKRASLMATYVPRLSNKGGNGDVLFLFAKVSF